MMPAAKQHPRLIISMAHLDLHGTDNKERAREREWWWSINYWFSTVFRWFPTKIPVFSHSPRTERGGQFPIFKTTKRWSDQKWPTEKRPPKTNYLWNHHGNTEAPNVNKKMTQINVILLMRRSCQFGSASWAATTAVRPVPLVPVQNTSTVVVSLVVLVLLLLLFVSPLMERTKKMKKR